MCRASPTSRRLGRWSHARTIAFASAHAVDAFFGALANAGRDARALFGVKLAAVGRATAARLAERSLRADFVGDGGGADLAAALVAGGAEGPALVLGAHGGRPELADALAGAGWTVEAVAAYDSVPDDAALAAAWKAHRARPFFAVAFTSPRGARAFLDLAGGDRALAGVRIGAIGETTRDALVACGLASTRAPSTRRSRARHFARGAGEDRVDSILMQFPEYRPRRLRRTESLRRLIRETQLGVDDFIYPIFVIPGRGQRKPISSLPGLSQVSVDEAVAEAKECQELGIPAVILFGVPDKKDAVGSEAWNDEGLVQQATRAIKKKRAPS